MNLVIDIGNTAIKIGWFENNELLEKQIVASVDDLKHIINVRKPLNVIASSTAAELFEGEDWKKLRIHTVSFRSKLPFTNNYETFETLGTDRICAVAGAWHKFPSQNILIINMGTCITYDFLSVEGIYFGGAISPGVAMRFKSMNQFTARLPELNIPDMFPEVLGRSTVGSMNSGVMNGVLFELEGMVVSYKAKCSDLKVILTGGAADIFEKKFKEPIFAAPDLVLIGLNVILQHNAPSL